MLILCATKDRKCLSLAKGEMQWKLHSEFPEDSQYGNLFSWTAHGWVNRVSSKMGRLFRENLAFFAFRKNSGIKKANIFAFAIFCVIVAYFIFLHKIPHPFRFLSQN